jgi:hypothetical protein
VHAVEARGISVARNTLPLEGGNPHGSGSPVALCLR